MLAVASERFPMGGAVVIGAMGGIDAHHVCPGDDELSQLVATSDSRAEGGNDFDMSVTGQSDALASRKRADPDPEWNRIERVVEELASLQAGMLSANATKLFKEESSNWAPRIALLSISDMIGSIEPSRRC